MQIDLLVPTRKRPRRVEELLLSVRRTAKDLADLAISFYVDDDDSSYTEEFVKHQEVRMQPAKVKFLTGPRLVLSEAWNALWRNSTADILMHAGDDIVFRTEGWDDLVRSEFIRTPDRIALVYGDDSIQGERLATHSFVSRKSTEILGYFVPPYFKCDYNDTWLTELYTKANRKIYLPHMKIEHQHFIKNPSLEDDTYREARQHLAEARKIWESTSAERNADAKKLLTYIRERG